MGFTAEEIGLKVRAVAFNSPDGIPGGLLRWIHI